MLIPIKCQGCGKPTGHLWDKYLDLVKQYRDESLKIPDRGRLTPSPEGQALDDLKMTRDCCRITFLCNKDMTEIIS